MLLFDPRWQLFSLDPSSSLLLSQMSVIPDVTVTWIMSLVDSPCLVLKLEKRSFFPSELCMYLLFDHIGRALSCLQRSFSSAFSGNRDLAHAEYQHFNGLLKTPLLVHSQGSRQEKSPALGFCKAMLQAAMSAEREEWGWPICHRLLVLSIITCLQKPN